MLRIVILGTIVIATTGLPITEDISFIDYSNGVVGEYIFGT